MTRRPDLPRKPVPARQEHPDPEDRSLFARYERILATDLDLDKIRGRHREHDYHGTKLCQLDLQNWPCDAIKVLDYVRHVQAAYQRMAFGSTPGVIPFP